MTDKIEAIAQEKRARVKAGLAKTPRQRKAFPLVWHYIDFFSHSPSWCC